MNRYNRLSYFLKHLRALWVFINIPLLLLIPKSSFCQIIGIKCGLNYSDLSTINNDQSFEGEFAYSPGYCLGSNIEFPIAYNFSLESGLTFSSKSLNYDESFFWGTDRNIKSILNYVELPFTLRSSAWLNKTSRLSFLFGPYIGLGISGKIDSENGINGQNLRLKETVKWGNDVDHDNYKKLDYGLLIGIGFTASPIQFDLTFSRGFANISTKSENGYRASIMVWSLSATYRFNDTLSAKPRPPDEKFESIQKSKKGVLNGNKIIY